MPIHFQNKTNVMNGLNKKECLIYIMKNGMGVEQGKQPKYTTFVAKIIHQALYCERKIMPHHKTRKKLLFNFILRKQRPEKYSWIFRAIYRRGSFEAVF